MKIIKKIFTFILITIIFATLLLVYMAKIEPNMLIARNYNIHINENKESSNIKIVQFTDTQLGEFYSLSQLEKAVNKINGQDPDIVLFTGDLIDKASKYKDIDKITSIMSNINPKLGKYAVWGNHDYGSGGHKYYENIMTDSGFKVLVNETVSISVSKDKNITISGLDEVMFGKPNAKSIIKMTNSNDVNILMLHEPDLISEFKDSNIDLAVAGHSHGGQVALPFIGAIITPPFGEKYTKGFYEINDRMKLYVNSGLGNTRSPFRLMNIPEISVFNVE
ncbi:metallophosphoesterase [[Clostridium] dakarense]|uniref:metallophosphoesterase n=1 Tax=Faecalimicrobium dakarense TaxID=1301100 RepID=UPI0004AE4A15|nr:metallophosphoesterase [[Clostridium] dakarense]